MKKIFLTGDASQDWLLFSEPYQPPKGNIGMPKNLENNRKAQMHQLPGGVLLLSSFIKKLLPDEEITLDNYIESGKTISGDSIETIAEVCNISKSPRSIHVKKFLGYSVIKAEANYKPSRPGNFPENASLIIIDDVGNDIRHFDKEWINDLDKIKSDFHIIYKTNWPLADNRLLDEMTSKYSDRITAIVSADDFREHGLTISRQLSWDKAVDDFLTSFPASTHFVALRKCHSIIVRFGLEAAIFIYKETEAGNGKNKSTATEYKLFYLPTRYEGEIREELKADMQGMTASFVAAFANHFLYPYNTGDKNEESSSENITQSIREIISASIMPGMYAAINCLKSGYCRDVQGDINYPFTDIFKKDAQSEKIMAVDISDFLSHLVPRSLLNFYSFGSKKLIESVAFNYVVNGLSGYLEAVPSGKFKNLRTYDREEIEDYRGFKKIVSEYLKRDGENKPLSYAVFGPPGSGKSFVVKQIIDSIGGNIGLIESNISQFESYNDLVKIFQASRDMSLKGKVPLVFFDEFDSDFDGKPIGWLKYFLAPMQDGVFKEGEAIHPLGKGIFIFAGGTNESFGQFIKPIKEKNEKGDPSGASKEFKDSKGPDFISRLKGFINIKGIQKRDDKDVIYSLRRAMMLREHLLKIPGIRDKKDKIFMDNDLLGALLQIPEFEHGARSLAAIVSMSDLQEARSYTKANLPSNGPLQIHVNINQFELLMKENYLPVEYIDTIARKIHENWLNKELKKKTMKETAVPWEKLTEALGEKQGKEIKESNRQQVMDMVRKIDTFNYKIVLRGTSSGIQKFSDTEIEEMARMEHARWMNEKIANGYTYGKPRNDQLKIHDCLLPYDELDETTKDNDRDPVRDIPGLLKSVGFAVVKNGNTR